jgi:TRAP-type transport system small permease protein
MGPIIGLANGLGAVNAALLAVGRWLGATAMGLMVLVILLQVFCRYALGSALAWPEEASRFLMLWSTGLMAPTAFRRGGFVAIDMVLRLLPSAITLIVSTVLLALTILILWVGLTLSWKEVTGIGGRFETDSLWLPTGSGWFKTPKSWMMASLLVGLFLLLLVAIELTLRNLITLFGGRERLAAIPETVTLGAE